MSDTIYRDDAMKAVCKGCLKENPHCRHHWDCPMLTNLGKLPSADRPSGEVDAVKEYEHHAHNLNQGYITLGEFDKRIEPLRHLHYDRPQGEWITCSEREPNEFENVLVLLSDGTMDVLQLTDYLDIWGNVKWCHAVHHGSGCAVDGNEVVAWMPLPKPWKGADDE